MTGAVYARYGPPSREYSVFCTPESASVAVTVALNPYLHLQDGTTDLSGKDVLVVHGTADRIAPPQVAARVVDMLRRRTPVTLQWVDGGKHAMLARHRVFDGAAASFVTNRLLGRPATDRTRAEGAAT